MELTLEKATPAMSPRGGVTYFVNGNPATFTLTHRTILTWESVHGGLFAWLNKINEDGYMPSFTEVKDIIIGSHLSDDHSTISKDETRKLVEQFEPEHYLKLSLLTFEIVHRAFNPDADLGEEEQETDKKKVV